MQCDVCGKKKATVHLTEIVDDQMSEMHLCEDCAREKSVQMEQQFGLADLLAGLSDFGKQIKDYEKVKLVCNNCGLNYDDFKKFGRLGCSECYPAFREQLSVLLKKIHGSNRHLGKAPGMVVKAEGQKVETLSYLREQLQDAIQDEDFERAAELRDKIRTMEKEQQGS
jgi:protein arginine kinase activator